MGIQSIENMDMRHKHDEKILMCQNQEIVQLNGCISSLKQQMRDNWQHMHEKDKVIADQKKQIDELQVDQITKDKELGRCILKLHISDSTIKSKGDEIESLKLLIGQLIGE